MRTLGKIAATLGVIGAIAVGSAAPAAAWYRLSSSLLPSSLWLLPSSLLPPALLRLSPLLPSSLLPSSLLVLERSFLTLHRGNSERQRRIGLILLSRSTKVAFE